MKNFALIFVALVLVVGVTYQVRHRMQAPSKDASNPAMGVGANQGNPDSAANSANQANSQTPGAAGSGAGGVASNGTSASGAGAPPVAAKPESNCFSYEYHHKKEAQSLDIEEFLDFSNAFPIKHQNWNQNTLCVKVNQKPVAFRLLKNHGTQEVIIGSVVGPESVIRVSYCTGKASCKEACATPKKRFLDEVADDTGGEDHFQDAWGESAKPEKKKELRAKVKELRTVASESSDLENRSIMREWDTLNQNDWTCKEK